MEIKSIRLGNPQQVQSEEDFDKGESPELTTDNQEIRLYFFDEDLPVPLIQDAWIPISLHEMFSRTCKRVKAILVTKFSGRPLGRLITLSRKKIYLASIAMSIVMLERELASLSNQESQRIQKVKRIISEFNMLYKRVFLDEKV